MWIKFDLDGIDFHLGISHYQESKPEIWDEQWCKADVILKSTDWLNYHISSEEILLSCEVETLRDALSDLLNDRLTDQEELEFIEPDLSFILTPKTDVRTNPRVIYVAPGHEIADIDVELRIHLWHDGLTANYISVCLDRTDLEKLQVYLRFVTNQLSTESPEVRALMADGIIGD